MFQVKKHHEGFYAAFFLLISMGCQDPTQVRLHVKTDVPYETNRLLSFTTTIPEKFTTAAADVVVDKPWGPKGDVGTLVLVPDEDKNGRLAIRVVMGVSKDPTLCTPQAPDGCIMTRRLLRFVENRSVELPIGLHAKCEGVNCDDNSTCSALGQCVSAEIDPFGCQTPADPGCLPEGDRIPSGVPGELDCTEYEPAMVEMPGGFCMDATEVTRTQYAQWLATNPSTSGQSEECSFKDGYVPSCQWPPASKGDHPVVCVDWCDAYAYCKGVGKRLCGKIGGGENMFEDYADATKSQWHAACTAGGTHLYPYGESYSTDTCNGYQAGVGSTVPVGSLRECQSIDEDYAGVFDLSGNVWEWEDSCKEKVGQGDICRLRGGSFNNPGQYLQCDSGFNIFDNSRDFHSDAVGFRCCSP